MKKFAALGTVAGIALALGSVATSAIAGPPPVVTSLTVSPTTLRSGETFTFTVNGTSAPDSSVDTFTGCYVYWVDGVPIQNQVSGAIALPANPFAWANYSAVDSTLRYAGWAGATCGVGDTLPTGTPTWDTGVMTITPQVAIDPITLPVGTAISQSSFPYTYKSTAGNAPYDWALGGQWTEVSESICSTATTAFTSALPTGVSVDDTVSAAGDAPLLALTGTPTTAGTYKVCMQLNSLSGQATAYMTIVVEEPKLPATGLDATQVIAVAGGAVALAAAGAALVLVRRRRA